MPQSPSEGLYSPNPGDPLTKSIHSAAWLKALVRAATGRGQGVVPQYDPDNSIELLTPVVDSLKVAVPAFSVIGAVGADYGSLTSEPTAYMQGTLERSSLLFYTRHDCPVEADSLQGFPFLPGVPVRVRMDPEAASVTYAEGIKVGRPISSDSVKRGHHGLILVSPPFTPDATNYFAWVILDTNPNPDLCVILNAALPAASSSKTGATHCLAAICEWDFEEEKYIETGETETVWNHSETVDHGIDTFGEARFKDGHYWFFGDCDAMADRGD